MNDTKIYDDQLIVITGAAGFIGSGVVRYLNDKGFSNLILVDDLKRSIKWKNLLNKQFYDFISRYELFEWLEGREREIEAFIHLGACSDTIEDNGDYFMENNYRFSVKLAEYALTNEHRFIYSSSAATYGDGSLGFSDDHDQLDNLTPLNLYGYSKQIFDLWLKRRESLDQIVGLKYFNIFGPNEYHKNRMASMVLHMTNQILDKGKVCLFKSSDPKNFADGDQCRDFFYVKDAVDMTCSFLNNDINGIFNAGAGEAVTWNRLAKAVFKALDKKPNIEYIPMPKDLGGYQNYTCADMSKYEMQLKKNKLEKPHVTPLEDAVGEYVKEYLIKQKRW